MNIKLIVIITFLFMYPNAFADNVITFFFRPYPTADAHELAQNLANKLEKSHKLARHQIEGIVGRNPIAGIFSTYAGFIESSNANGQVIFPRKHAQPKLTLIITNKITPVMMFSQTVHHMELEELAPKPMMYTLERKQDQDTAKWYWDVQQVTDIPRDYSIPAESIVIIAKPHYIYVPTGITLTSDSPNLVLPNIYVKKGINIIANSLYMLNLMHLFRNPDTQFKKQNKSYEELVS